MPRLLIVSHDLIGERMAGVGIRYYETARALAQDPNLQVTLAAPPGSALPRSAGDFRVRLIVYPSFSALDNAIRECDVLLAYPDTIWQLQAVLSAHNIPVVVDGYDITLLEHLELDCAQKTLDERMAWQAEYQRMMTYVLGRGDLFLAATERQRDWWLGMLAAAGRINPVTYEAGPSLRHLVALLPYGLPQSAPVHTRPVMRGMIEGIRPEDKIILWGGGIWQWLDPLTLIRAAEQLAARRPDVKFVFPGVSHPAHKVEQSIAIQKEAVELARSLGLLGQTVFMGDWVAYEDWPNYLLESDVGVSLHRDHLETRLSARTRLLSYLWAGLPMVLTQGDELAGQMAKAGLAILVEEGDATAAAEAIEQALTWPREKLHDKFEALRRQFHWSNVVKPLRDFCLQPSVSPDRLYNNKIYTADAMSIPNQPVMTQTTPSAPHPENSSFPPELQLSPPSSFIARLLSPLLDALVFWRLRTLIWQQNQINQAITNAIRASQEETKRQINALQASQEETKRQINALQASQEETKRQIAQLAARLTDAENLQTDLIAATAKRL
ncbi:MAG: glycosyltransferase [Thermoflexales bacterium]